MTDTLSVLVVVDVQNCFMYNLNPDSTNAGDFLHLSEVGYSEQIASEISKMALDATTNLVVFTRDFHPVNHISFAGDEGRELNIPQTWPRHCRNKQRICNHSTDELKPENLKAETLPQSTTTYSDLDEEGFVDKDNFKSLDKQDISQSIVYGTDLSYLFYNTNINKIVYNLNQLAKEGKNKIGLKSTNKESGDPKVITENDSTEEINTDDELYENKYITLTKGEKCNQESYSAFNYHIDYDITDKSKPVRKEDFYSLKKENSTGLWEFIIKQYKSQKSTNSALNKIKITVCGLVTQVCVMHTVVQGKLLWDKVYNEEFVEGTKPTVEFVLSFKGTGFTPGLLPEKSNTVIATDIDKKQENSEYVKELHHNWILFVNKEVPEFKYMFRNGTLVSSEKIDKPKEVAAPSTPEPATTSGGKRRRRTYRGGHKRTCKCKVCGGKRASRRKYRRRSTKRM
jgi:nicotinamidase-related amidase